jgi:hypothetical protein
VSTDIRLGESNHQSAANFIFDPNSKQYCRYWVYGTYRNPSFSDVTAAPIEDPSCRSICVDNRGGFDAQFRLRAGYDKETDLSAVKQLGRSECWYSEHMSKAGEQLTQAIHRRQLVTCERSVRCNGLSGRAA